MIHFLGPIDSWVARGEELALELLDHGVVIGLCAGAALVFVAVERGGVQAMVARWVVPVMIGRLVWGLRVQGGGWVWNQVGGGSPRSYVSSPL